MSSFPQKMQALWDTNKIQTCGLFFVFNVIFPSVDLITDCIAAVELGRGHFYWSLLTIFWMFGPFVFTILLYIVKIFKKSVGYSYTNGFIKIFLHFPFILPLTNTILAIHLFTLDLTNPTNSGTIETIKRTAAISGLYESFLESAPQMLTQVHIILCTGQITDGQKVQIFVHILTFTLSACKAFYVQRKSSESDPDPSFKMILILFAPMLVNVVNSATQWTVVAGLLKEFVFIPIFVMIIFIWPLLIKLSEREKPRTEMAVSTKLSEFRRASITSEVYHVDTSVFGKVIKRLNMVADDAEIDEGCFVMKASLTCIWLPCVVGSYPGTFLISSLYSLITRSLILLVTFLFSQGKWYPDHLRKTAYLFFCNTEDKMDELFPAESRRGTNNTCFSLGDCFNVRNDGAQLHRVCGDNEDISMFMVCGLLPLLLFSLISTLSLHRYTSYMTLFQISKIWVSCSPFCSRSIIHRSLIFQLIQSGNHEKLQEIGDIIKKKASSKKKTLPEESKDDVLQKLSELDNEDKLGVETVLDRQCSKGCSPLHLAVLIKDATAVRILLESGAKVEQDSLLEHPLTSAFTTDTKCFEMILKYLNMRETMKAFHQAVKSNNIAYCLRLLEHNGSSIPYRSNILLGGTNGYETIQKFDVAGEGRREVKSISINFSLMACVTGLQLVWSDGTEEVLGLSKDHAKVKSSVKVDTPKDANFSFVRGKTADNFIVAMAFDTVSDLGVVKQGQWIECSDGNSGEEAGATKRAAEGCRVEVEKKMKVIHTIGILDIGVSPMRCVLDGFKGRLDANLADADVMTGHFDYHYFLTKLAVSYRMALFSNLNMS